MSPGIPKPVFRSSRNGSCWCSLAFLLEPAQAPTQFAASSACGLASERLAYLHIRYEAPEAASEYQELQGSVRGVFQVICFTAV